MTVDAFFSRLNPLVSFVLRTPLHVLLSRSLLLLTVTGHRTGRRYSIPVGYQREGDRLVVMVSEAQSKQWWRNYREPRPVDLLLRGRERRGIAGAVPPESPEFRDHAARTLRRLPSMGRVFGINYDRRQGLTDPQVKELGEQIAIVSIALDEG